MKKIFIFILLMLSLIGVVSAVTLDNANLYHSLDNSNISSGNPLDLSGNNYDGTNNGATTGSTGILNEGFDFDGTADYVSITNGLSTSAGTISLWFNADSVSSNSFIFNHYNSGNRIMIYHDAGEVFGRLGSTAASLGESVSNGVWYHAVLTWDGSTGKFYVNNSLIDSWSYADLTSLDTEYGYGAFVYSGPASSFYDGDIDEVAIYTRALNTSEISTLYNNGNSYNPYYPPIEVLPIIAIDNISLINNSYFNDDFDIRLNLTNISTNGNINTSYFLTETFNNPQYNNSNISYQSLTPLITDTGKVTANQFCVEEGYDSATDTSNIADTGSAKYYTGSVWADVTLNAKNYDSITCIKEVQFGTNTLKPNATINISGLSEGNHSIYFYSYNNETNITSDNYNFGIDITNPLINKINNLTLNSFSQNFSEIINYSDALSDVANCFLNITELENVTNPDNFYINCTDTQVFTSNGLHNFYAVVTDNAGNINTLSFNDTIQTFIYINYFDENATAINNYSVSIFHPDGRETQVLNTNNPINLSPVNNGELDLGNHTIQFNKTGYKLYNVTIDINESSSGTTYNYTIPGARIFFEFFNIDNGSYIENETTTTIQVIGDSYSKVITTTNRNYTLEDLTITSGEYQVIVSNNNYETTNTEFTFTNQEFLNLSIYMTPLNLNNTADIIIETQDLIGNKITDNLKVYLYIWDADTLGDVLINQKTTYNGQTSFKVILNERSYTFCAEYNNELFCEEDRIIDVITTKVFIKIDTSILEAEELNKLYEVSFPYSLSNTTSGNDSTILFTWTNSAQDIDNYCLAVYEYSNGQRVERKNNCSTLHSSNIGYVANLSTNNSYYAQAYIIDDGERRILDSLTINQDLVLEDTLSFYGLDKLVALLLLIIAVSIGLSKRVHNVTISHTLIPFAYLFTSIMFPSLWGLDLFVISGIINFGIIKFINMRDDQATKTKFRNLLQILFIYMVMIFTLVAVLDNLNDDNKLDDNGIELYNYLTGEKGAQTDLDLFIQNSTAQIDATKEAVSPGDEEKTDNTLTTFIKLLSFVDTFFDILSKLFTIPATLYYMLGFTTTFLTGLMLYINWIFNVILVMAFYDALFNK